ncbi:MAG: hypothetical protein QF530_12720 [SAR202 cluster bacterium]|jgi:hypothetical protein|nr:hypothetical protein [SAR202 cluster bacterium]|tara:strand:- start:2293 stop:3495 length:1203 start_codon:yes stop_codon:yes gene_type:complete
MTTRNSGGNEKKGALERVQRSRWVARVERTADLLLTLLEKAPQLVERKPHFPPELESRLRDFLHGGDVPGTIGLVETSTSGTGKPVGKPQDPSAFTLCLNEKNKTSLAEFLYRPSKMEAKESWAKWTLNEKHNHYVKTGYKKTELLLEFSFKTLDGETHPVGHFKLDLPELEKKKLVKRRIKNGSVVYDIRIALSKEKDNETAVMVSVPTYLDEGIRELALQWKDDSNRPVVRPDVEARYEKELKLWIDDPSLPMLIRKHRRNRGHVLEHESRRKLVPVDNAPANWFFSSALFGFLFEASDVLPKLENDSLPIGMIADPEATYKGHQSIKMDPPNLNTLNFKICHVEPVGIGYGDIKQIDLKTLKEHMYRFLSVGNMFLIPKQYGALGELTAFLEVFRDG